MEISEIVTDKDNVCERILRSLPEWFGIEEAIQDYVNDVKTMPMFAVRNNEDIIAFVSLNHHNDSTAEIHVMGVHPDHHRKGLGQLLVKKCESYLTKAGAQFLTVKTLSPARENEEYQKTRYFYEAMGFKPLEEFKTLWGEENPCLFMAKSLDSKIEENFDWTPPTLATDRMILRALVKEDAPAIFQYAQNPKVSLYTLWEPHKELKDAIEFIESYAFRLYSRKTPEPFGITLKRDPSKVIGTTGCFWVSKANRSMELAYAIDEKFWGQGLVAEASRGVVDYVFNNFEVDRIQARCKAENKGSARVMEKLGMNFEGTLRKSIIHRNQSWDMKTYSLLKAEWEGAKK